MLDKLNVVFQRFNEVNDLIIQPDIISDAKRYVLLNREYKNLKPLVEAREQFIEMERRIGRRFQRNGQDGTRRVRASF